MDENPYRAPVGRDKPKTFFEQLYAERKQKTRLEKWTLGAWLAIILGPLLSFVILIWAWSHRMDPIAPKDTGLEVIFLVGGLASGAGGVCVLVALRIWKRYH
jgi:hypothetical protein